MVVQLLVRDNRAYGAIAFNFRTGEWYAIRAKAVVLAAYATGSVRVTSSTRKKTIGKRCARAWQCAIMKSNEKS